MRKTEIKPIPKGGSARDFQTVDSVKRTSKPTHKHEIAIALLEQSILNFELELANKQKVIKEMVHSDDTQSSTIHFTGIKIRVLLIEIKQLKRSVKTLKKFNKPLELSNYDWARSSRII